MQVFRVTLAVEVNTSETVSESELRESLKELTENWDGGNVIVNDIEEY